MKAITFLISCIIFLTFSETALSQRSLKEKLEKSRSTRSREALKKEYSEKKAVYDKVDQKDLRRPHEFQNHYYRKLGDQVYDLRILENKIRSRERLWTHLDKATTAEIISSDTSHIHTEWLSIYGTIRYIKPDSILIENQRKGSYLGINISADNHRLTESENELVLVEIDPNDYFDKKFNFKSGENLSIIAKRTGTVAVELKDFGGWTRVSLYKYGKLMSESEIRQYLVEIKKGTQDSAEIEKIAVQEKSKAAEYLLKKAEDGDKVSQHSLGLRLIEGNGIGKDSEQGISWIRKSAEQGYAPAINFLDNNPNE